MEVLEEVKAKIKEFISEINHPKSIELLELLPTGKMLRSKLILKIAGYNQDSIKLCAIVEMIHAASLLHDDVIDESMTRRGKASINAIYNNKTSIMFGDILYSIAFTKLTFMNPKIAYNVSNAVTLLSIGEMMDVDMGDSFNDNYELYLDMIYKKTGSLIESCAASAALLAGLEEDKYALYGKNLGIAFQMVDDILDITSDEKTLGKPVMADFKEGKVTIPYLKLYNRVDIKDKKILKELFKKELTSDEIEWLKDKFQTTDALKDSILLTQQIAYDAISAIKDENNKDLVDIMQQMCNREF
ncbi:MAG: polyprenyl synthetase family protein [Arcobacteraceae bacterium]|nr:polyprenyl synthetase family protein [Arcobacteraceae bacterium]